MYINHVPEPIPYHAHQTIPYHVHQPVPNLYHITYQDHQEVPLTMYHIIINICASTMFQNKYQTMNHNVTKMCLNMYYHNQVCTITLPRYASRIYHITHDMSQSCHTPCTIRYHQLCASTKDHNMCLNHVITSP
jgi:hypothetical protein